MTYYHWLGAEGESRKPLPRSFEPRLHEGMEIGAYFRELARQFVVWANTEARAD